MQNMSRDDLVAVLTDMTERVAAGDSFEGNVQYLIADHGDHPYDVSAAYRIGNTMGQGGMRLIGVGGDDTPRAGIVCPCGDTDGPFADGICEGCLKAGAA